MRPGRFITFEGGEGGGKTTQVALLVRSLEKAGISPLTTREPGGSPGAEIIRRLLVEGDVGRWDALTESLLHFAARQDHLTRMVKPAMREGRWVVCDRFADSTMAYQGYAQGLGREPVEALHRLVVGSFVPDLTLVLDLPVAEGLRRAGLRTSAEDRYERMGEAFHETLRSAFLDIARRNPGRCAVVPAAAPVEEVHRAIVSLVRERLDVPLEACDGPDS
ncbi:MAG: dTMP kinase [Alphaproteobacteria bacterium]|nr:dTMP kinase [Alphaproteobacteria bacterium]